MSTEGFSCSCLQQHRLKHALASSRVLSIPVKGELSKPVTGELLTQAQAFLFPENIQGYNDSKS